MVAPPLEAGYWIFWLAAFCVILVLIEIGAEYCSKKKFEQKMDQKREALVGPITSSPASILELSIFYEFLKAQWCAFTIGSSEPPISPRQLNLLSLLIGPSNSDQEIPRDTVAVSWVYVGFEFGESCEQFGATDEQLRGHFEYQMICTNVQCIYFVEDGKKRRMAGVTWYLRNDEKSKNHEDYNMIAIYETIREKRFEEVQKIRKLEKEEALRRGGWLGEPTDEYTSTIFSHLKLLTLKDGRLAVFACNADGEEEKFAFNERTERYEVLEDVVEVEDRPSNYLLRII
ncbi:uncharacterized protein CELE_C49A1.1 [Caenorhabditis elegans]|uniref:Uncharacterized protein n=1 Tax=Caenorhabditis elegans TaxID=6239 RepID=O17675_CAEEL|nr:Uncharacterized protein CELE_C49A1.1 [Caenorhabditis elegans]CAB05709.2 Uncharacterized protein CELE_C49A1.1 [Caenorhabditis elegans]|eukprot:NP_493481.2 Uncharacterized protein CELE_C49A1.1 [Caenorhabditis elegans]